MEEMAVLEGIQKGVKIMELEHFSYEERLRDLELLSLDKDQRVPITVRKELTPVPLTSKFCLRVTSGCPRLRTKGEVLV